MKNTRQFTIKLSESDMRLLSHHASYCSLSKSAYMRHLIQNYVPKVAPPYSYHLMVKELRIIGGNLNQLAKVANAERYIDVDKYKAIASYLFEKVDEIEAAVSEPISIEEYTDGIG